MTKEEHVDAPQCPLQDSVCVCVRPMFQTVEMHKEKVSRREIGAFTAVRRVARGNKIQPPTCTQGRPSYSRRPISYQQLDGIGHGVKASHRNEAR